MFSIERSKKPKKLKLFLAKPNKVPIAKLKHAYGKQLTIHYNESNELSFTLPYEFIQNHKRKKYKPVSQIKEKYLIKAIYGDTVEWYVVNGYSKNSNDTDELRVQCYSLEHQLNKKRVIDYKVTSYNCLMVTEDTLKDTGWKVGYINPDFNLQYREFDVTSNTKLAFLYDIAKSFEAIIRFNTVNKTVNFYKEQEISQYKGFSITERKYLESVEENIDSNDIVTRLYITGADGLGVQGVNPTGQRYIDDFSYFLYPFEMDNNGNVIAHSNFMEDDLAISLVNYNEYVSSRKGEFSQLLDKKSNKQEQLTTEQNTLEALKTELQLILDEIEVNKKLGLSTIDLEKQRSDKDAEISSQETVVSNIQTSLTKIDDEIKQLSGDLKMENHISPILFEQLQDFIHEDEWSDDTKIDENDLYETGIERLSEINSPPVNMNIDIVNFFEVIEEQQNWERMNIGDIVRIKHNKLGILVKARITSIGLDFEGTSISLTISNLKEINDIKNKLKHAFYTIDKVNTDYNKRKINWNTIANNFNLRNDRIKEIPENPYIPNGAISHKENDNGSVNLTIKWQYSDYNTTKEDKHNIDGFLIYLYSSESEETYHFGSQMAEETMVDLIFSLRTYTFPSVPSNLYYTLGIRAYRRVDDDINSDGIVMSDIVRFDSNTNISNTEVSLTEEALPAPYRPSETINFNGRINGVKHTVDDTEPENPNVGDVWVSTLDKKTRVWDGEMWSVDNSAKDYTDQAALELEEKIEKSKVTEVINADGTKIQSQLKDGQVIVKKLSSDNVVLETTSVSNGIVSYSNQNGIVWKISKEDNKTQLTSNIGFKFSTSVDPLVHTTFSLLNGWTNYGNGTVNARYTKTIDNIVHLSGDITGGLVGEYSLGVLPVGCRPLATETFTTSAYNGTATISVYANGDVRVTAASSTDRVSLSSISFYAGN